MLLVINNNEAVRLNLPQTGGGGADKISRAAPQISFADNDAAPAPIILAKESAMSKDLTRASHNEFSPPLAVQRGACHRQGRAREITGLPPLSGCHPS